MTDDLPALFRAAHAAIGDEIVPPDRTATAVFLNLESQHPITIAVGIVHTQIWLAKQGCEIRVAETDSADHKDQSRTITIFTLRASAFQERCYPFGTDAPATIYAAMLRLATRVKEGE